MHRLAGAVAVCRCELVGDGVAPLLVRDNTGRHPLDERRIRQFLENATSWQAVACFNREGLFAVPLTNDVIEVEHDRFDHQQLLFAKCCQGLSQFPSRSWSTERSGLGIFVRTSLWLVSANGD